MEEMASRISDLERSLAKTTQNLQSDQSGPQNPVTESANAPRLTQLEETPSAQSGQRSRDDVLVQKGSSSQYFNEIILSKVLEEEQSIESAITTPPPGSVWSSLYPSLSPFNALGILSSPNLTQTPSSYHPSKAVAVKLWNIYMNNVDGCAGLKLLHVPTDEIKIYSTIDNPTDAPFENHALCLAIYYAATISIEEEDVRGILQHDKYAQLLSFKVGLEQALAQGDFLDRPTLTALLALAIYLSALRVHNPGKGIWILNGMAIRVAESMGLQRDGERLGLSPFQSEIRRRLWWHLIIRDGRAGEDYGLENTRGHLLSTDVRLPLNVNDTDIYPEMKELPMSRIGWTTMTFSLIHIELVKSMLRLARIASSCPSTSSPSEEERVQIVKETEARIEELLVNCTPVVPYQRLTLSCSRWLLRKLNFITRQQWLLLQHPHSRHDFAREESLVEALELLQPRLVHDDELLMQFAWAKKAYPQHHVTLYILWHLCVKPESPNAERAWRAVDELLPDEQWDEFACRFGSKSAVISALKAKALAKRKKTRSLDQAMDVGTSEGGVGLDTDTGLHESGTMPAYPGGGINGDFDFDIGNEEWPDWTTLAQEFQPDGQLLPGVFWQ